MRLFVANAEPSKFNALIDFMRWNYNPRACSYTYHKSAGNDFDVFGDGFECGYSTALYDIACRLGIYLERPLNYEER